ncbi:hypothetical protein MTBLM1_40170 [Rhodospirillaceae bacterium LM-1]|nr:hypothetical protein MTBLM1_40170 [Rhodospirillaceae bacterium LM-1]
MGLYRGRMKLGSQVTSTEPQTLIRSLHWTVTVKAHVSSMKAIRFGCKVGPCPALTGSLCGTHCYPAIVLSTQAPRQ